MTLERGASLSIALDELEEMEKTVHDDLRVYRLRPDLIETPAIYNWILPTRTNTPDNWTVQDEVRVAATIVVDGGSMEFAHDLLEYADAFREAVALPLVRGVLLGNQPLNGACHRAQINRWGSVSERINDVPLLGIQFELGIDLQQN